MFYRPLSLAAAAALFATSALADGHATMKGFALAENGTALVTMQDLAKPNESSTFKLSTRLDAIAYRPVTDSLVGFSKDKTVYSINKTDAQLADLKISFDTGAKIMGEAVAFDFNNKLDAARAVGSKGTNLVYFPSNFADERAGTVKRFKDTFYASGDINEGKTPYIFANAYTNAINGKKAGSTFQYALDANTNALVSLANNAGELKTIAKVSIDGKPVELIAAGGFDIASKAEGENSAYAILELKDAKTSGLYSIDLKTAEATMLVDLGTVGFKGFAVSLDK